MEPFDDIPDEVFAYLCYTFLGPAERFVFSRVNRRIHGLLTREEARYMDAQCRTVPLKGLRGVLDGLPPQRRFAAWALHNAMTREDCRYLFGWGRLWDMRRSEDDVVKLVTVTNYGAMPYTLFSKVLCGVDYKARGHRCHQGLAFLCERGFWRAIDALSIPEELLSLTFSCEEVAAALLRCKDPQKAALCIGALTRQLPYSGGHVRRYMLREALKDPNVLRKGFVEVLQVSEDEFHELVCRHSKTFLTRAAASGNVHLLKHFVKVFEWRPAPEDIVHALRTALKNGNTKFFVRADALFKPKVSTYSLELFYDEVIKAGSVNAARHLLRRRGEPASVREQFTTGKAVCRILGALLLSKNAVYRCMKTISYCVERAKALSGAATSGKGLFDWPVRLRLTSLVLSRWPLSVARRASDLGLLADGPLLPHQLRHTRTNRPRGRACRRRSRSKGYTSIIDYTLDYFPCSLVDEEYEAFMRAAAQRMPQAEA